VSEPQQRLPHLSRNRNARLKISLNQARGTEIEILGNRDGLRALAAICTGLADLTDDQLLTPANHFHLDQSFWGAEKGSVPMTVYCLEGGLSEG
jgi:hypothetical protein